MAVVTEMICWILLLIILSSCVCDASPMNVTTRLVNDFMQINVWNIPNMSYLDCTFHSNTNKVLVCIRNGRALQRYDEQFKGRVEVNYNERTANMTLSHFGPADVGNYTCFSGRTGVSFGMDYNSHHDVGAFITPEPTAADGTTESPAGGHHGLIAGAALGAVALVILGLCLCLCKRRPSESDPGKIPSELKTLNEAENGTARRDG
ncbi:uncharacterized protein [Pempheris klunzingeri]|uniref:uncharacterized protein n=1 Tax=Pempheris klunzingeri TaxID=3127111 RepID=UPI00397E992F